MAKEANKSHDKPKRRDDGTMLEQPVYLRKPKGSKNKISKGVNQILGDEDNGGLKFLRLLFDGAIKDLMNPEGTGKTFRVQLCAAFMLKTMAVKKAIEVDGTFKNIFSAYNEVLTWTPEERNEWIRTDKKPKQIEAPEYEDSDE